MDFSSSLGKVNSAIEDQFSRLGTQLSKRPYVVLATLVVIWGACLSGFSMYTMNSTLAENWIASDSVIHDQIDFIDEYFADQDARPATFIATPKQYPGKVPNVLTVDYLSEYYAAFQEVIGISIEFRGESYSWYDLCDKPGTAPGCFIYSPFLCYSQGFMGVVPSTSLAYGSIVGLYATFNEDFTDEATNLFTEAQGTCFFYTSPTTPTPFVFKFGGTEFNSDDVLTFVSSLQSIFVLGSPQYARDLRPDDNVKTIDDGSELMRAFERAYLDKIQEIDKDDDNYPLIRYDRSAVRSIPDTEKQVIQADIILLTIGYIVVAVVCIALNVKPHPVRSQAGLAAVAILMSMLSIAASFGFMGLVGISFTPPSIQVLPFLGIGLAVDDIFVILNAFKFNPLVEAPHLLSKTLRDAGVSVTLTSTVNCIAFFIGSLSTVPAVGLLSMGAAIIVIFNWITLVFGFSSLLYLDILRMKEHKRDVLFCTDSSSPELGADVDIVQNTVGYKIGQKLFQPISQISVILASLGMLAVAIYGITELSYGLTYSEILPGHYYFQNWWEVQEDFYTYLTFRLYAGVDEHGNEVEFDWENDYEDYLAAQTALADLKYYNSRTSWIDDFLADCGTPWNYTCLPEYLGQTTNALYFPQFIVENNLITFAYVSFTYEDIATTSDKIDALKDIRNALDDTDGPFFAFSISFSITEQFIGIENYLAQGLMYVAIAVFASSLLFLLNPIANILMMIPIAMIVTDVLGFIHFAGLQMNGITVVNLVMAVGVSVEFTAHFTRHFMIERGTRVERAQQALGVMGYPIFLGAITTFLGVLPLAFAVFPYYQLYFFAQYALIVAFGTWHGLVFLPVLLSLVGPSPLQADDASPRNTEQSTKTSIEMNN